MGVRLIAESLAEHFENHGFLGLAVAATLLHGIDTAFEPLTGAAIERPDEPLFPVGPILITRAHAVGEREKHERVEIFAIANDATELLDGGGVLEIPALGHLGEQIVGIHEREEHASAVGRELQAACDLVGEHRASLLVMAGVGSLADIMEKDGEIEDGRILELLENLPVAGEFFFSGKENAVQLLDTDKRVLIRRVAVVELVLDKAIQRAELRYIAAKDSQIVHEAERAPDLSLPGQDGKKCLSCGDGVLKGAIDEVQSTADEIHKLGVELKLPDLRMVEGPHETVGVVVENIPRLGLDAAVANNETVELLGFLADTKETENALRACDRPGLHFLESVFRHEINRSGVPVVVAHEGFDLAEDVFLGVVEFNGNAALELERQDIS